MSDTENVSTVNHSTQTYKNINDETRIELLTLANMFLHSSYWFLALSSSATRLNMSGFAWALKEKEKKCTEAVLMFFNSVNERGGSVEFADIAKPQYRDSAISTEFIAQRWNDVEDWLQKKIESIIAKLEKSEQTKPLITFLESLITKLKSVS